MAGTNGERNILPVSEKTGNNMVYDKKRKICRLLTQDSHNDSSCVDVFHSLYNIIFCLWAFFLICSNSSFLTASCQNIFTFTGK